MAYPFELERGRRQGDPICLYLGTKGGGGGAK